MSRVINIGHCGEESLQSVTCTGTDKPELLSLKHGKSRDVNKAGSFKAKAKARSLKAKTKAKARDQG